jgi:hypothetical protein
MTRTALRCMAFLVGIQEERPTRKRIAAALKRSERSLERPIAELVKAEWIMCKGGGHGTPSKIIVLNSLDWKMRADSKMRCDSPVLRGDSGKMRGDSFAKSVGSSYAAKLAEEQPASLPRSENPKPQTSASEEFTDFVRSETRFKIGGNVADEGTVRRLASTLGNRETYARFRVRLREWCQSNTPQGWGILVVLAREVAAGSSGARETEVRPPVAASRSLGERDVA